MKKIILKNIETEPKMNYRESLMTIIKTPMNPREGISIDEMRKSVKLLDLIEIKKDEDEVELEDADYDFLKKKVESFKFAFANKIVLQFIDDILLAEEVKKEESTS